MPTRPLAKYDEELYRVSQPEAKGQSGAIGLARGTAGEVRHG